MHTPSKEAIKDCLDSMKRTQGKPQEALTVQRDNLSIKKGNIYRGLKHIKYI